MAVFPLRDSSSSSSSSNRDYNRRDGIVGIAESSSSTASSEDEKKSLPLLAPEDAWISTLNIESFRRDIRAIGARYHTEQGPADIAHLRKLCLWSNICAVVGLITMAGAAFPSRYFALTHSYSSLTSMPMIASLISSGAFGRKLSCSSTQLRIVLGTVSVMALSLWTFSRWAAIAHHCCHGGYNNCYATANHEAVSSAKYANDRFDSPCERVNSPLPMSRELARDLRSFERCFRGGGDESENLRRPIPPPPPALEVSVRRSACVEITL